MSLVNQTDEETSIAKLRYLNCHEWRSLNHNLVLTTISRPEPVAAAIPFTPNGLPYAEYLSKQRGAKYMLSSRLRTFRKQTWVKLRCAIVLIGMKKTDPLAVIVPYKMYVEVYHRLYNVEHRAVA